MLSTFPLLQINFYIHSIPFSIIMFIYVLEQDRISLQQENC